MKTICMIYQSLVSGEKMTAKLLLNMPGVKGEGAIAFFQQRSSHQFYIVYGPNGR